jgi:hypothetical protein
MAPSFRPKDLHASGVDQPLALARQAHFWVGVRWIRQHVPD